MSLSSSRASRLPMPALQMAPPVQTQRFALAELSYQRRAGLEMHALKGTSLRLVLPLITVVASSTRSRCFADFIGRSSLVCTKNIYLFFSVVFQYSEHDLGMSLQQIRLVFLSVCMVLGWNQRLVWSKHWDSSACVPASWRLPEFLLAEEKTPSFLILRWLRRNYEENESAALT